jgi:hypothetical protein
MARQYGVLHKKYRSQLKRCAISGLRFYKDEMVKVSEDTYVHRKFVDDDWDRGRGHGRMGIQAPWDGNRSLIRAQPYGTPLRLRGVGSPTDQVGIYAGGD